VVGGRSRVHKLAVLLALVIVTACGGAAEVNVTDADAGRTVDLQVGQILVITLAGLGAAGYLWEVTSTPGPTLEQIGDRETLPLTSGLAGASARESFRFKGAQRGETTLRLGDRRAFGARDVAKTFEVTVRVR
jgi:predicted secreted protein